MIDLSKSLEYFDPSKVREQIHIVGCGSVGSTLAENLGQHAQSGEPVVPGKGRRETESRSTSRHHERHRS